jgi:hypothetical protein
MAAMTKPRWPLVLAALASCGGGRDVFPDAEALEKAGKLEEAAARFDVVCAYAPAGARCKEADARAFEARMKAADAAIAEGRFVAADRLIRQAEATAGDAERKRAEDRLAQEDVTAGVAFERALAMTDRKKAASVIEPIAAGKTPAAAKAKAWLDKEGPAILAAAVKAACGPDHDGSCSEAFAKLQASGAKGPDADEATRAAEAEQRRVYPLRTQGENFVRVFASRGQQQRAYEKCMADKSEDVRVDPTGVREACEGLTLGTDPDDKRYQANKNNEDLFRRLLQRIADPAIARDLEARKARALAEGEAQTIDVPKPKPAPRSP